MSKTKYHQVKPFPHGYCLGCFFNGCFPWNRHPFLLCSEMDGMRIALHSDDQCLNRKEVDFDAWNAHFKDLKDEAELNETVRLKAMHGGALSNQVLPAEQAERSIEAENSLAECLHAVGNPKRLQLTEYCIQPRTATEITLDLRMNPNTFGFHFRVLAKCNLVRKVERGIYETTMRGKVVLGFCEFWRHSLGEVDK